MIKDKNKSAKYLHLSIIWVLGIISMVLYHFLQPVVSYEELSILDGNQYIELYNYFTGKVASPAIKSPFNSRILVPWLASMGPFDTAILNFKFIHVIFTLLSLTTLYFLWRKVSIPFIYMVIGIVWLLFHWSGMVRLTFSDPLSVDTPLYFFQTCFLLILLDKKKYWLGIPLVILATMQKESFMGLCILTIVLGIYQSVRASDFVRFFWWGVLWSACSFVTLSIINQNFPETLEETHSPVIVMVYHFRSIFYDPFILIRWLVALFTVYGFFVLVKPRKTAFWLSPYVVLYLIFGLLAGMDHTRILFNGFPFIMTFILINIRFISQMKVVLLLIASLVFTRIWGTIPNAARDWNYYTEWFPEYASYTTVLLWGGYIFLFVFIYNFLYPKYIKKALYQRR